VTFGYHRTSEIPEDRDVPESGARLINGRYALTPSPRRGGMAEVFAASDLGAGAKKVAVKLFKEEYTHSELLAEAFRRECQALRDLRHPHIVTLLDTGKDGEPSARLCRSWRRPISG